MTTLKPTEQEMKIITIMLSIAFGVIIGLCSMNDRVNIAERERDILLMHADEVMKLNNQLMSMHSKRNAPQIVEIKEDD